VDSLRNCVSANCASGFRKIVPSIPSSTLTTIFQNLHTPFNGQLGNTTWVCSNNKLLVIEVIQKKCDKIEGLGFLERNRVLSGLNSPRLVIFDRTEASLAYSSNPFQQNRSKSDCTVKRGRLHSETRPTQPTHRAWLSPAGIPPTGFGPCNG